MFLIVEITTLIFFFFLSKCAFISRFIGRLEGSFKWMLYCCCLEYPKVNYYPLQCRMRFFFSLLNPDWARFLASEWLSQCHADLSQALAFAPLAQCSEPPSWRCVWRWGGGGSWTCTKPEVKGNKDKTWMKEMRDESLFFFFNFGGTSAYERSGGHRVCRPGSGQPQGATFPSAAEASVLLEPSQEATPSTASESV